MVSAKLPLHDIDAEEAVVGSILIDDEVMPEVARTIKAQDFYSERNKILFEGCSRLKARREGVDQITLAHELDRMGKLEACGGAAYLSHLVSVVPTSLDAGYYADIVRRCSVYRQLRALGKQIEAAADAGDPDTNATLDRVSGWLADFKREHTTIDSLITPEMAAGELIQMLCDYETHANTISWGFRDLDRITTGIYPELIIVGARPSVGKTEFMLNVAANIHEKILFCSSEMTLRALQERKIARELKVSIHKLRRGEITAEQKSRVSDMAGEITDQVYYLPPGISSQDIYDTVARMKDAVGVSIVFVDYLQILRDCWTSGRESLRVRVGAACKTLKAIVNDFNVPVVCASQLNRELEYRPDDRNRPKLADLRESGDIEQDADVVLLLWRDKDNPDMSVSSVLEVKMAKNRQLGDAPKIDLIWLPGERRYADSYR